MNELLEIINTVLANANKKTVESVNDNMHLRNDLGFDSFNLAELTVRIEEKFGIDVFEKGLINTIGEVKRELNIL
ncbi:MAG: acyl carrier protein [Bacteroidia bacterium]|nr:acyl carrier protein [Bacteroidia bacterium]